MQATTQSPILCPLAGIDEVSIDSVILGRITAMKEFINAHRTASEEYFRECAGEENIMSPQSKAIIGKFTQLVQKNRG